MFGGATFPNKSNYYEILGVPMTASPQELKKGYKRAALQHHPDKGGDPEKFKELAQAYEVLIDPMQRKSYDDMIRILTINMQMANQVGSGFGGRSTASTFGEPRQRCGQDMVHSLKVSLEDLYRGTWKKFSISHNVLCYRCKGTGFKYGGSAHCCGCEGTGVIQDKKVLEVHVEKGMRNGQAIRFCGEGDEAFDTVTGDVVFIILEKEHPKFKRKKNNLFVEYSLSLGEALCGYQFVLNHLDGRQLVIKSNPGEVVKHDSLKVINDEGMPMYQMPGMKGKLYIRFSVDFPDYKCYS